ncbi:MAG: alpha/beta hydrolase [Ferruginibacter sp.]
MTDIAVIQIEKTGKQENRKTGKQENRKTENSQSVTEKTIKYQNSNIFYRITGEGKTIVLLHGFAEDGDIWSNQVDFLKDHFRIIIPDIPGSGRSDLVANANIETYAEVVKLILDTELQKLPAEEFGEINLIGNIGNIHSQGLSWEAETQVALIGHSMGGYITLAFAEKYPRYLDSFGLFHSSAFADDGEKKEARKKAIDFMTELGAGAFLKTAIPGLFTKAFAEENFTKINHLVEKGRNFSAAALVQYYRAMIARPDRTAVLKTFPKPILFIIGEYDNAIPLQSSLRQCYLPAQSHVHILNQSAHMGMWEEKEKANNILFKFLINKF